MPGSPVDRRRQELGARGESLVAAWYTERGYAVLGRNWRCREGELDLVVARGRAVVFCEVKARRGHGFGLPAEAVTGEKQRRVRRLAGRWLGEGHAPGAFDDIRFDVACVTFGAGGATQIDVIEAAF